MSRKLFATASPDLMQLHCPVACYVRWTIKVLLMIALIVGLACLAGMLAAPTAKGNTYQYCTPSVPFPPYGGVCTGGWGNWCTIGLTCSPVPDAAGTLNPNGYTSICNGRWVCPWE